MMREVKTTRMPTTKEVTYEDVEDIVEFLVSTKSHRFTFDCYTYDDIAQEIRIICFQRLGKLDTSRPREKWANWFGTCVDRALFNLKRDKYIRYTCPCKEEDCEFEHTRDTAPNKICEKWLRHKNRIQRKFYIYNPINIDAIGDAIRDGVAERKVEYNDFENYLVYMMPPDLKDTMRMILGGHDKGIARQDKERIKEYLEILE